jgi:hypothetical protein
MDRLIVEPILGELCATKGSMGNRLLDRTALLTARARAHTHTHTHRHIHVHIREKKRQRRSDLFAVLFSLRYHAYQCSIVSIFLLRRESRNQVDRVVKTEQESLPPRHSLLHILVYSMRAIKRRIYLVSRVGAIKRRYRALSLINPSEFY